MSQHQHDPYGDPQRAPSPQPAAPQRAASWWPIVIVLAVLLSVGGAVYFV